MKDTRRHISIHPFLLAILLSCSFTAFSQTAQQHYTNGLLAGKNGNIDQAIAEMEKAIELKPDYVEAWYIEGIYKFNRKDPAAEPLFTKTIQLQPTHYKAWAFRGMCKFRRADYPGCILDMDSAIAIQPDYPETWFYRGDAKMEIKDYDGALKDLDTAIRLKPEFTSAWFVKGLTGYLKKDDTTAIAAFDKVIAMGNNTHIASSHYFKGLSLIRLNQKTAGCNSLHQAVTAGYADAQKDIDKNCN